MNRPRDVVDAVTGLEECCTGGASGSACVAIDQLDRLGTVERTTQENRPLRVEDLAVDLHEVTLAIAVHLPISSQDDASAVGIFLPQRSVTEHPETTVGMHVKQLPRHPAVIRGATHARFIPTVQFKRV